METEAKFLPISSFVEFMQTLFLFWILTVNDT